MSQRSREKYPHESQIYTQKNKLIQMEAQARRMARNLQIQKSILKNKKLFQEMELELQKHEAEIKKIKKQIISKRISEMEQMKKQRQLLIKATNHSVINVFKRQRQKKSQLQERLKTENQQYQNCYQKALNERKRYLNPINFEDLKKHEVQYMNRKLKTEESIVLQPHYQNKKSPRKKTKAAKSVVEQYQIDKQSQKKKKKQIKQLLKKRNQYGNDVEKQYLKNRVKTENIEQEKRQKQRLEKVIERQNYLRSLKKPKLHPVINAEKSQKFELKKLKKSLNLSPEQKIEKLEIMREDYDTKFKRGNTEALDKLSRVNLAKADLCLNLI